MINVENPSTNKLAIRTSLDNFQTNLSNITISAQPLQDIRISIDPLANPFQNLTSPLTIRLYCYYVIDPMMFFNVRHFEFNGTVSAVLPVTFGKITAEKKDERLLVKWTTQKETNNDHFEIQASTDGSNFKTLHKITSKNGNSDIAQDYEVTIGSSALASFWGLPLALGLLGFCRRNRILLSATAVITILGLISCSKDAHNLDTTQPEQLFIRIQQIDKDCKTTYSKIVEVIEK